jgi:lipopolysaccharide biosynthesis glycosyltransferase
MLKIWMGHDPREAEAYAVAKWSFARRASKPLDIRPIKLGALNASGILTRPIERQGSKLWCPISQAPMATEFAISRFAVPFLGPREGWALFCDCDVIALDDVAGLFAEADPRYAVQVVQHRYMPKHGAKMDGVEQTIYSRKNWSSVMLWNLAHPAHDGLTLTMLNEAPGRDLHRFAWLAEDQIGHLSPRWNWLVGEQPRTREGIAHFTLGGPWFDGWQPREHDELWLAERDSLRAYAVAA